MSRFAKAAFVTTTTGLVLAGAAAPTLAATDADAAVAGSTPGLFPGRSARFAADGSALLGPVLGNVEGAHGSGAAALFGQGPALHR